MKLLWIPSLAAGLMSGTGLAIALPQDPPAPADPILVQDGPGAAVERALQTRVTLELDGQPAKQAIGMLAELLGVNLIVKPDLGDALATPVSLRCKDLVGAAALELVLQQAGLRSEIRDGVVVVAARRAEVDVDEETVRLAKRVREAQARAARAVADKRADEAQAIQDEIAELAGALKRALGAARERGDEETLRQVERILQAGDGKRGEPRTAGGDKRDGRDPGEADRLAHLAERLRNAGRVEEAERVMAEAKRQAAEGRGRRDEGAAHRGELAEKLRILERELGQAREEGAEKRVAELERALDKARHAMAEEGGRREKEANPRAEDWEAEAKHRATRLEFAAAIKRAEAEGDHDAVRRYQEKLARYEEELAARHAKVRRGTGTLGELDGRARELHAAQAQLNAHREKLAAIAKKTRDEMARAREEGDREAIEKLETQLARLEAEAAAVQAKAAAVEADARRVDEEAHGRSTRERRPGEERPMASGGVAPERLARQIAETREELAGLRQELHAVREGLQEIEGLLRRLLNERGEEGKRR